MSSKPDWSQHERRPIVTDAPAGRRWFTERQLAEAISYAPQTLRNWRCDGQGPPFVKRSNGTIVYDVEAVRAWIATAWVRVDPTDPRPRQ